MIVVFKTGRSPSNLGPAAAFRSRLAAKQQLNRAVDI